MLNYPNYVLSKYLQMNYCFAHFCITQIESIYAGHSRWPYNATWEMQKKVLGEGFAGEGHIISSCGCGCQCLSSYIQNTLYKAERFFFGHGKKGAAHIANKHIWLKSNHDARLVFVAS